MWMSSIVCAVRQLGCNNDVVLVSNFYNCHWNFPKSQPPTVPKSHRFKIKSAPTPHAPRSDSPAPPMGSSGRTISQPAFDALVTENIADLGMDPDEALADAVETLTLQGVDLSGIVKCIPGVNSIDDNPVVQTLTELNSNPSNEETIQLLDKLRDLCSAMENASVAMRNGGIELLTSLCAKIDVRNAALKALAPILHDVQSTEVFRRCDGPKTVVGILNGSRGDREVLENGFAVVAAAATGNEVVKEAFMDLKIDELIVDVLKERSKDCVRSLYDAIRVLLTPDDNRVAASQVYGYARRFAQIGTADALVFALQEGFSSTSSVSACIALRAIAVNDEICRSISESGGIDAVLQGIDDSGEHNNRATAKACCSLLSKLAGSDDNKSAIIQKGGLDKLMKLSSIFSEDPSVIQEVMSIIGILSLRSPENAARAVEAGAGDLAVQAMQRFPAAAQMQRHSCLMIRNLAVRSQENRTILLGNGIERLIRRAKHSHESCKDAATAALRDLGLDDYNT